MQTSCPAHFDPFRPFPHVGHGVGQPTDPHFDPHQKIKIRNKKALKTEVFKAFWSCYPDLNWGPHPYQGCALPTELQQQMATRKGLEPSTSGVTGRRSNQLNYRAIFLSKDSGRCNLSWQGQKDSNPRHSVLETDALPAELYPYKVAPQVGLEPTTLRLTAACSTG